jgi:hypothetical protein
MNRKKWVPNVYSRLCARHFTEDCFTIKRRLKPHAVPTLFGKPESPSKVRGEVSNVYQEHNYCPVFLGVAAVVDDEVQVNVSEATEVTGIVDEAVEYRLMFLKPQHQPVLSIIMQW